MMQLLNKVDSIELEKCISKAEKEPDEAARLLATSYGLPDPMFDSQAAIQTDFLVDVLRFCLKHGYSLQQTSTLHSIAHGLVEQTKGGASFAELETLFKQQMLAFVTLKSGSDAPLLFTTLDVKHVTDFFTSGFFQHLRLYQYCLTKEQAHLALQEQVMLETAELGFPPLSEAMTEAERDDWQASRAAAAAAAEAERRARAEAEEAARLAAVEAARIAAEEEAKKRKPQTLEEAVEFAVRDRLAAERKAIEEEHAKREKELLDRIAQLEAARAKMAGDGGNKSRGSIQG